MIYVLLDKNNYYTGSYSEMKNGIDNGINVESLPTDLKNYKTKAWKLVDSKWQFDEAKHAEILAKIEEEKKNQPKDNKELTEENVELKEIVNELSNYLLDLQYQIDTMNE